MELVGKVALVTGASRGLGRALAASLAEAGAQVALVARREQAVEDAARALRESGKRAIGVAADVGDKNAIYPLVGQVNAVFGPVDILVNNASELGPTPLRLLLDTACEDLDAVLGVNVVGPFRLTKAVLGSMVLRGAGTVVNVSSDAATTPYARWGAYGASKAALDHMGRIWASELEGTGVRIFSVDPGEMDTAMHASAMPEADRASLAQPEHVARTILNMIRDGAITGGVRLEAASWRTS